MDEAVEAGLFDAHFSEELLTLGGFELSDFGFHGAANADDFRTFFSGSLFDDGGVLVAIRDASFVDIGDVKLRFHGDEEEVAGDKFFVVGEVCNAGRLASVEDGEELLDGGEFGFLRRARSVTFGCLFGFVEALFDRVEVG